MYELIVLLLVSLTIVFISIIVILANRLVRIRHNIELGIHILEDDNLEFSQEILIQDEILKEFICQVNRNIKQREKCIRKLTGEVGNQKKLLTSISHDLRTPLTSLLGYLEMMVMGALNDDELQEYVQIVYGKATDIKKYTDNMFDWFKLSNSNMKANLKKCNVNELTRKIIIDWIPLVSKSNIEFTTDIPEFPIYIDLDETFFCRIINNIINNALIHSNCNTVCISINHIGSIVQIKIVDDGIGIKESEIKDIFEWLYTGDFARTKGSGIGLNIVKMLVDLLGGEIRVESRYGEGTAFFLDFHEKS